MEPYIHRYGVVVLVKSHMGKLVSYMPQLLGFISGTLGVTAIVKLTVINLVVARK